ncbi:MAG: hypothetical protein OHK0017_11310 [Patescibacteria group bacterium]
MAQFSTISDIDLFIQIPDIYLPPELQQGKIHGFKWSELESYREYFDAYVVTEFIQQGILAVNSRKMLNRMFSSFLRLNIDDREIFVSASNSHTDGWDGIYTFLTVSSLLNSEHGQEVGTYDRENYNYLFRKQDDQLVLTTYLENAHRNANSVKKEFIINLEDLRSQFQRKDNIIKEIDLYLQQLCREFGTLETPKFYLNFQASIGYFSKFIDTGDQYTSANFSVSQAEYSENLAEIVQKYDKSRFEKANSYYGRTNENYKPIKVELEEIERVPVELNKLFDQRIWKTLSKIDKEVSTESLKEYMKNLEKDLRFDFVTSFYDKIDYLTQQTNSCFEGDRIKMYKFKVFPNFNFWKGWDNEDYLFVIPEQKIAFILELETSD